MNSVSISIFAYQSAILGEVNSVAPQELKFAPRVPPHPMTVTKIKIYKIFVMLREIGR